MGLFGPDLPRIIVGQSDHHDLLVLAMSGDNHTADAADDLLFELGRAAVRPDHAVPETVVKMGDEVTYSLDGRGPFRAVLAFPHETAGRPEAVSILSLVGTALLGLSPGQVMHWTTRDGRHHTIEVHAVNGRTGAGARSERVN